MKTLGSSQLKAARRGAMLCLSLSMVLASLGTSIANIALPTLALAFDVPFHWVQWIVIAYLVSITLFVVIADVSGTFSVGDGCSCSVWFCSRWHPRCAVWHPACGCWSLHGRFRESARRL